MRLFRICSWPKWQRLWLFVVLGGFWLSGAVFSYRHGNQPYFHTDSSTEGMSIFAANYYLDHGFFKNYLLPMYPPFGPDPEGKPRTEPFVYNHYLAGPDLVLGMLMKVFGREALWSVRLIPHTLTVIALAWLSVEFAVYLGASVMGCILASLLMVPRSLTAWSICIYGHSYVMAFFLFLIAGMLSLVNLAKESNEQQPHVDSSSSNGDRFKKRAWGLGFAVGLLQMFFDLDWLPMTFMSGVSFVCLMPGLPWKQAKRVLIGMFIGGTTALLYQVFISSLYYGSAMWVVNNLIQWIQFRTGQTHVEGFSDGEMRLHKVLHEFNRQTYGSTGFTALNLVFLSIAFLILGFLGKVLDKVRFYRGLGAIALAYLAASIWNIVMRQHSVAHLHFIPRHYIILYVTFMLIALPVSYSLVDRSRRLS